MYEELYEVWKQEFENTKLVKLTSDFYLRLAGYFKRLAVEDRMLDRRSVKAMLLRKEMQNARRMVQDLANERYKKITFLMSKGEKVPLGHLATQESEIYSSMSPILDMLGNLVEEVLRGRSPEIEAEQTSGKIALRFLKDVPAVVGGDMKSYGPFKTEDVASLPVENAKILIREGMAEKIETNWRPKGDCRSPNV